MACYQHLELETFHFNFEDTSEAEYGWSDSDDGVDEVGERDATATVLPDLKNELLASKPDSNIQLY